MAPQSIAMAAFVVMALAVRVMTLAISRRNQRRLEEQGAAEIGPVNSTILTVLHAGFYVAAIVEGVLRGLVLDAISAAGVLLWLFGIVMLFVVIRSLGRLWTVRVFIAADHKLNTNWIFRNVRHPNYYLAILPELFGFGLALHAFVTLVVGMPFYVASLSIRIRQEEVAMRAHFANY
jgi:isoprenylcysteine carboxyl methyltransferase (ICMT) family protein YpbQ